MKVVRMMVIIPHVMVEEPHKMAKALHILTEAPLEKTFHHLRQFWLSITLHIIVPLTFIHKEYWRRNGILALLLWFSIRTVVCRSSQI